MLREIGSARQDVPRGLRHWYQDDYFDLYVWQNDSGAVTAFQLCYDRNRTEGAITWNSTSGFTHDRVDAGEHTPKHAMTPILRADGNPPYFRLYHRFVDAASELPPALRSCLVEHLRAYRVALFGQPRKPRRARPSRVVDSTSGAE